jgi:release factor glutamine methyltransferase
MKESIAQLINEIAAKLDSGNRKSNNIVVDADTLLDNPENEAELLVAEAAARSPQDPRSLSLELAERRLAGELLGHIIGHVTFLGCEILTAPDSVIPRMETQILGIAAITILKELEPHQDEEPLRCIDMCCGAGNLACAMAWHVPKAHIWAADLTIECVRLTNKNIKHLGLQDRVTVHQGDLFSALSGLGLEGKIDLVACNPPYISSGRLNSERSELLSREPREAFDGGPYGLTIHQRVLREASVFLRPGGWLLFEIGVGQERQLETLLKRSAGTYGPIRWELDSFKRSRTAVIQRT